MREAGWMYKPFQREYDSTLKCILLKICIECELHNCNAESRWNHWQLDCLLWNHKLHFVILHCIMTCFIQYIPINMHMVFALLCSVVVIHWLIFPYPSGLLHWHCGNLTIAPVPAKQPRWIWINTSCEFITIDCVTTTKQSTTKPCAYFLGYTVVTSKQECPFSIACKVHYNIIIYHRKYSQNTSLDF